jgi:deazaflavin-dependent oxidoreductase (nitroreductase family)
LNATRYSALQSFVQKLASTRAGAWFLSLTLHRLDSALLSWTRNRTSLTAILAGVPIVALTCIGAKSGTRRTVPLLCVPDADPNTFALVASNWGQHHHPGWYYNLLAHPRATCVIDGRTGEYVAHPAEGEEYERFWQRAADIYAGFPLYKIRAGDRQIPIMVLSLKEQ